jgi:hypothetical protein
MGYDTRCEIVRAAIREIDKTDDAVILKQHRQSTEYVLNYIEKKLTPINKNIDVEVTVKYTIKSIIDTSALAKDFNGNLEACLLNLLEHDDLISFVEDEYKLVSVKEIQDDKRRSVENN